MECLLLLPDAIKRRIGDYLLPTADSDNGSFDSLNKFRCASKSLLDCLKDSYLLEILQSDHKRKNKEISCARISSLQF